MAHRGWQRQRPTTRPADVLEALEPRVLDSLERCRIAWHDADDPMALVAALELVDGLPDWLRDALVEILTDGAIERPTRNTLAELWARRQREAEDRHRATAAASARALLLSSGVSWRTAYELAERLMRARFDDVAHVSPDAIAKSYQRVRRELANPGRYHLPPPGLKARVLAALERQLARLLARKKGTEPGS